MTRCETPFGEAEIDVIDMAAGEHQLFMEIVTPSVLSKRQKITRMEIQYSEKNSTIDVLRVYGPLKSGKRQEKRGLPEVVMDTITAMAPLIATWLAGNPLAHQETVVKGLERVIEHQRAMEIVETCPLAVLFQQMLDDEKTKLETLRRKQVEKEKEQTDNG
jgi:hypothetical protein